MAHVLQEEHDFIAAELSVGKSYSAIAFDLRKRLGDIRGISASSVKLYIQQEKLRQCVPSDVLTQEVSQAVHEVR